MSNPPDLSSTSSLTYTSPSPNLPPTSTALSLNRLSNNLQSLLLDDAALDWADAEIEVDGSPVAVHRCVLAVRSPFFHDLFATDGGGGEGRPMPRYSMTDLVPVGRVGLEAFKDFLWYIYTGRLKAPDPAVATCADGECPHDACRPVIDSVVEFMYALSVFQISEFMPVLQRRLLNFVEKAFVEDVIPILLVAFRSKQSKLTEQCVHRIAFSNLDDMALHNEIPHDLAEEIRSIRSRSQSEQTCNQPHDHFQEKSLKRIHRALDSDDVELVKLLLNESDITLDVANALHYAASYCDSKVVAQLLELEGCDINLKSRRGYTPLHMAAMRREPSVIIALLKKGAYALAITDDGRNAVGICRRLTRMKDYTARTEQGEEPNRNQICIDILEREMRISLPTAETMPLPLSLDDLHLQMHYYQHRG